ncbi:MAG: ADP-ribosylglycohydrolase family protein [Anaerolineae bacterium]|nr:ADP-ribosylglycohydrolase family protein [Anaerolineae bacterium]
MNYVTLRHLLQDEVTQRREEGCDVTGFDGALAVLLPGDTEAAEALYRALDSLEPAPGFPYHEPSSYDGIRAARPAGAHRMASDWDDDVLLDRILGAWLGRCAGCCLGKPVEGWPRQRIEEYLRLANAFPLDAYVPLLEPMPQGLGPNPSKLPAMAGHINGMPPDDDMNYTILGLSNLERKGPGFTSQDVADSWLARLPFLEVATAEHEAYRNLVNGLRPPHSATYRNPYREWIGARIRADAFGYCAPGWPERAAEFAYRDAAVSHVKNGIYGEMWVAAMLAAALVSDDLATVLEAGLAEIPAQCRLAEAVRAAIAARDAHSTWQGAWDALMAQYGHYHRVHTINNALIVLLGLLYGEMDLGKTICIAVMSGLDTDCNGATAGSIVGAMLGAKRIPQRWVDPFNDRLLSLVVGYHDNRISDLAKRTLAVAQRVRAEGGT